MPWGGRGTPTPSALGGYLNRATLVIGGGFLIVSCGVIKKQISLWKRPVNSLFDSYQYYVGEKIHPQI